MYFSRNKNLEIMKHTKEEWKLEEPKNWPFKQIITCGNLDISEAFSELISTKHKSFDDYKKDNQNAIANAKLIAAAPELLEALKYAVKFINLCPLLKDDDKPCGLEAWEEAIKKATE